MSDRLVPVPLDELQRMYESQVMAHALVIRICDAVLAGPVNLQEIRSLREISVKFRDDSLAREAADRKLLETAPASPSVQ